MRKFKLVDAELSEVISTLEIDRTNINPYLDSIVAGWLTRLDIPVRKEDIKSNLINWHLYNTLIRVSPDTYYKVDCDAISCDTFILTLTEVKKTKRIKEL